MKEIQHHNLIVYLSMFTLLHSYNKCSSFAGWLLSIFTFDFFTYLYTFVLVFKLLFFSYSYLSLKSIGPAQFAVWTMMLQQRYMKWQIIQHKKRIRNEKVHRKTTMRREREGEDCQHDPYRYQIMFQIFVLISMLYAHSHFVSNYTHRHEKRNDSKSKF